MSIMLVLKKIRYMKKELFNIIKFTFGTATNYYIFIVITR